MKLTVNQINQQVDDAYRNEPLLWALRDDLGLTGTHYGCGIGKCGSCMVLVDDAPTRSCQTPTDLAVGTAIVTIEGLEKPGNGGDSAGQLHAMQQAFIEFPLQCMWCLPGHLMVGVHLLANNNEPTAADIEEAISENLCRCGGYNQIRQAFARGAELNRAAS
jgi:aerobic-type carbon monoxide dehydrogenase small subunit (CoxS/CutS family)